MKKEALEKARETRAANAAQFAKQVIPVGDKWRIIRSDELNWEVQKKNKDGQFKFDGFYGSILDAFKALPAKMLGEEASGSLATLIDAQKSIVATIEKALSLKMPCP